jgi:hypothetical protein
MSKHIYLPDVVFNRTSVSFRVSICIFLSISGRVCCVFSARPATRPGPALAPHTPMCPVSLSFCFPRSNSLSLFSTSLPPLCPRCDPLDGYRWFLDPKVSSPPLSPSLPPLPSFLRAPLSPPGAASLSPPSVAPCPPAARRPCPGARPPCPCLGAWRPCPRGSTAPSLAPRLARHNTMRAQPRSPCTALACATFEFQID